MLRTFLIGIIVLALSCPACAQVEEVYFGVNSGRQGGGGRVTVTKDLRIMFEYFEGREIGFGGMYDGETVDAEAFRGAGYWSARLGLKGLGFLRYSREESGDEYGYASMSLNRFRLTGSYDADKDGTSGYCLGRYAGNDLESLLQWRFKGEKDGNEVKHNYTLSTSYDIAGGEVEAVVEANSYKSSGWGIVGRGVEMFWTPAIRWAGIGAGVFDEKGTGSFQRYRLRVGKEFTYRVGDTLLGVGGTLEGFVYSNGDQRMEASAAGRIRHDWESGSWELKLKQTSRTGETPFTFDHKPAYELFVCPTIRQKIGNATSELTASYDVTNNEWRTAQGNLQLDISQDITGKLTAAYDLDGEMEDGTAFTVSAWYRDLLRTTARMNYRMDILSASMELTVPMRTGEISCEVEYDVQEKAMEFLEVGYRSASLGRVALSYSFDGPSIIARFQALKW